MQNPPKSQFFVRARALQYSRFRSAGHTKCNCALRAQINAKIMETSKSSVLATNNTAILVGVRVCNVQNLQKHLSDE